MTPAPERERSELPSAHARIAILVPCCNEASTVKSVVDAFRASTPNATVYVYDNNSRDGTPEIAAAAGAVVRKETRQGKGNVVRRMFSDVEADVYVLVDGDGTYDATAAPLIIEELMTGPYDMVNAARVALSTEAYRPGHAVGNVMLTNLVRFIFGSNTQDMLSGYRAFSRRYVKSFPAESHGFEIETELVIHSLQMRMPVSEIKVPYRERLVGSSSKLHTVRDGVRILRLIVFLIKEERPITFFGIAAAVLALLCLTLGIPVINEFLETGLVPRLPTAVLAVGVGLMSLLALACGLILDTIARGRREAKRLGYLAHAQFGRTEVR